MPSLIHLFCLQGTSADQDTRFSDKEKKLLKQMKFSESLNAKVTYLFLLIFSKCQHHCYT